MTLIKQFQSFLNTPSIWNNEQFGIEQFNFPVVDLVNFSPTPIPDNLRLGHQMESICKQLLEHSSQFDVLVYNLPIREGKQTLGEIDFILKDAATKQIIHVELTYKFYIINPDISEPLHQLIGPNKSDAFFMKMEKIKNKQFALLHSEAGTAALSSLNIDASKLVHQTCFKAQLFKPYNLEALHLSPLNKNCIVGYWLRLKNFTTDAFRNYQFYIPTKKEWALNPEVNIEWISYTDALLDIELQLAKQKSPLVWMKKNDMPFEKFFVVWW
ncbi:hypothetical protein LCGC14_0122200 [marine sediment metagenome]|uniref:DUF1853 domain-containing protein n=1 Tax=marine sediment metagenome TaxID=412755 RepID=A0A0F9Y867_9ZZZZ|nr:DUF1853 family protein [Maribacter sp.]HDZ05936.1 DUF1853 family protein [Maribacter sp.]HEA81598.1 DUF1853 family protein [Maribacter sp.]